MKYIWRYLDSKKWYAQNKYRACCAVLSVLSATIGLLVWLIIRNWLLTTPELLICLIGYPVVISWFVLYIYSWNHDFHDGGYIDK